MKFDKQIVTEVVAIAGGAFIAQQVLKNQTSYLIPAALALGGTYVASQKRGAMRTAGIAAATAGAVKLVNMATAKMMNAGVSGLGTVTDEYGNQYAVQGVGAADTQLVTDGDGNLFIAQTSGVEDFEINGVDGYEDGVQEISGVEGYADETILFQ